MKHWPKWVTWLLIAAVAAVLTWVMVMSWGSEASATALRVVASVAIPGVLVGMVGLVMTSGATAKVRRLQRRVDEARTAVRQEVAVTPGERATGADDNSLHSVGLALDAVAADLSARRFDTAVDTLKDLETETGATWFGHARHERGALAGDRPLTAIPDTVHRCVEVLWVNGVAGIAADVFVIGRPAAAEVHRHGQESSDILRCRPMRIGHGDLRAVREFHRRADVGSCTGRLLRRRRV